MSALSFRIGTDICHIPRIRRLLCVRNSVHLDPYKLALFLRKIFTRSEFLAFAARLSSSLKHPKPVVEHLAGRWAAKEAIIKVSQTRIFPRAALVSRRPNGDGVAGVILKELPPPMSLEFVQSILAGRIDNGPSFGMRSEAWNTEKCDERLRLDGVELCKEPVGKMVALSISHDGDYAIATALAT